MDFVSYILIGLLLASMALFALSTAVGLVAAVFFGCLGQMIVVLDRAHRGT